MALTGPDLGLDAIKKVKFIRKKLKMAQSDILVLGGEILSSLEVIGYM